MMIATRGKKMARDQRDEDIEEMDEDEMDEDEDLEMDDTCPGCGLERSEWKGNEGQGVSKDGETYCCQSCADGIDCTCAA